jgi:hypothetical protein
MESIAIVFNYNPSNLNSQRHLEAPAQTSSLLLLIVIASIDSSASILAGHFSAASES